SWYTILVKRENYRKAFDNWDARRIAQYDAAKVAALLENPGIIRNKLKVNAAIQNAKAFLAVQQEFGSFDQYIWSFVGHQPILHHRRSLGDVPAKTAISDAMSKDLLKRGFKFVGSTTCYAFMQATGMVNDHMAGCWKAAR
ncbi:MAG TPA: DNA-3-methyladenine glycosylase I, partial [Chitinophaga sp.]